MAFSKHQLISVLAVSFAAAGVALAPRVALAPIQQAPLLACLPPAGAEAVQAPLDAAQQALVGYLTRRFQIAAEPTARIVETAYRTALHAGLDPLLVLAVISVESRFNPIAESGMGARGLMQIIPKYHLDKLAAHGGEDAVLDPESNIAVGTQILREYVRRTGSLEAGLQYYNGAAWDEEARYTARVLSERRRLALVAQAVLAGT
ncbi:MAG TPA: transglycosylase SLT domain-containing protein [Burkholderiales bacterium]